MMSQSTRAAQIRLDLLSRSWDRAEYRGLDGRVRHKCFLSYHSQDSEEVLEFAENYKDVFIPKAIGVSEDAPFIDSTNNDYIMDKIREVYLSDSTVTIVLVGACTWSRKFVDWEVYSSLRRDRVNRLNGLLAIELQSAKSLPGRLPARVSDNIIRTAAGTDTGYARYVSYPSSTTSLQSSIEDAFQARTSRAGLINNTRVRRVSNGACSG